MSKKEEGAVLTEHARPVTVHETKELQHYGTVARLPIALDASVCAASAGNLNQLLADTMTLRDLYKKHHWQVSGPTFFVPPATWVPGVAEYWASVPSVIP